MHRDQQKVFVASIINCPLATKPKSNTPLPNTNIKTHHRPIRFKSRTSNRQKEYLRQSLFLFFFSNILYCMKSFDGFMRHVQQAEQPTGTRLQ